MIHRKCAEVGLTIKRGQHGSDIECRWHSSIDRNRGRSVSALQQSAPKDQAGWNPDFRKAVESGREKERQGEKDRGEQDTPTCPITVAAAKSAVADCSFHCAKYSLCIARGRTCTAALWTSWKDPPALRQAIIIGQLLLVEQQFRLPNAGRTDSDAR